MRIAAQFTGRCSHFGGPEDMGVDSDEGLAFLYEYDDAPRLFLDEQPPGTTGLARRLDPDEPYVACRWDYDQTPKTMLANPHNHCIIYAPATDISRIAWPADWGPAESTGRVADISPSLMESLGIETDDTIVVIYIVHE
jgi:hypothetical protein